MTLAAPQRVWLFNVAPITLLPSMLPHVSPGDLPSRLAKYLPYGLETIQGSKQVQFWSCLETLRTSNTLPPAVSFVHSAYGTLPKRRLVPKYSLADMSAWLTLTPHPSWRAKTELFSSTRAQTPDPPIQGAATN